jgi:lipid-binding SYLF domain-containing protein
MKKHLMGMTCVVASAIGFLTVGGCATAPATAEGKADIRAEAATALGKAQRCDPSLVGIFNGAAGYAVFPTIGKGGAGIGGAYGKGVLYENGMAVGYCDLSQASIGAQLGGQSYTEIICFEDANSVDRFRQGKVRFDAQATAVALKSGAGANAKYREGVTVFTMDETGLMAEASVGGQEFSYQAR